jgi:hypothetical protein
MTKPIRLDYYHNLLVIMNKNALTAGRARACGKGGLVSGRRQ